MISLCLFAFAGLLNSIMDTLRDHFSYSFFKRWKFVRWINPSLGWQNKTILAQFFFERYSVPFRIGFFIFGTILASFMDLWHFCKFLMIVCLCFACINAVQTPIYAVYYFFSFTISFTIFYKLQNGGGNA